MKLIVKMKNRSHRYDIIELYQDIGTSKLNMNVSQQDDDYAQ